MGTRVIRLVVALAALAGVAGCGGGGGGGAAEGRATMTIVWPTRSRGIPAAANSVKAALRLGASVAATRTAARPSAGGSSTVTFDSLRVGTYTVEVAAHPNANGTGTAQGRGYDAVTIVAGQTSAITFTMDSTVASLQLSPANPSVVAGSQLQLSVTGRDSTGATVVLWPSKLQWWTGSSTYATVDLAGLVTGVRPTGATPGSVTVTVTDAESGKVVQAPLTVTSNATVNVTPDPFTLSVGDTMAFAATVQNAALTGVTWSVAEGASGGSISAAGVYTAPATSDTYHVVATSAWDNSKSDSATVEVQSGGAVVIID